MPAQAELDESYLISDDGPDRREQIINAAHALLDEGGLGGLTIRAVLNRTGLARRAFYDEFAGKDDLLLAAFAQLLKNAELQFSELVAPLSDPLDRLERIVREIIIGEVGHSPTPLAKDNRSAAMSREHLRLAESRPAELHAALQPLLGLIEKQLIDGIAAGQVRNAPTDRMASFIYNLVATMTHAELIAEESTRVNPERREQLADDIWEFCRRAIVA